MLTPEQVEKFHLNGFVKGSRVLTDSEIETLQKETLRVIDDRETVLAAPVGQKPVLLHNMARAGGQLWQIVDIWMASKPFKTLACSQIVAEEVQQLTGAKELRLFHDQIQYKPAAAGGVSGAANMWHQDSPYWPVLTPKDVQVTAWVALDDVDEENGCMSMVPGSHRWGDKVAYLHSLKEFEGMPDSFDGHDVRVVTCPVEIGTVHFHHPLTWHGSAANKSGRPRRAIALHFMTERALHNGAGGHAMKHFVEAAPGEKVVGAHFPLVWAEGVLTRQPDMAAQAA